MQTTKLGNTTIMLPRIVVGCMRLNELDTKQAGQFIHEAIELGANFFDHADIYGGGECERIFSKAVQMSPSVREKIVLQSKCGIRPDEKIYDFSREHILRSVDGILQRLQTDYLDILLLHRPDALADPEEVAEAFDRLHTGGKVRYFGVSNHKPAQIQLLQKHLGQRLMVNQLQLSITNATMISNGMEVNMTTPGAVDRDGSVLDFCRLNDITIQAWSPFQYGTFEGVFLGNENFPALNEAIDAVAAAHGVSNTTIAVSWLLRHPAGIQVIAGSTKIARLREICAACDVTLSRQEWYQIYLAAGNILP